MSTVFWWYFQIGLVLAVLYLVYISVWGQSLSQSGYRGRVYEGIITVSIIPFWLLYLAWLVYEVVKDY